MKDRGLLVTKNIFIRRKGEKNMNKSVTVLFESEMEEWRRILEETETPFTITNMSDYDGVMFEINYYEE